MNLTEGQDFRTGGRGFFVILKQGLGRLRREGTQDAVRWGRRDTRARDRLRESEWKRGLKLG